MLFIRGAHLDQTMCSFSSAAALRRGVLACCPGAAYQALLLLDWPSALVQALARRIRSNLWLLSSLHGVFPLRHYLHAPQTLVRALSADGFQQKLVQPRRGLLVVAPKLCQSRVDFK